MTRGTRTALAVAIGPLWFLLIALLGAIVGRFS